MNSLINVFNVERFATHDGPGIRTTVFLKGCHLHCPWCANPESQESKPTLFYDKKKCVHCHRCVHALEDSPISFPNEVFHYDKSKADKVQACVDACLDDALSLIGEYRSIDSLMEEIAKDDDYYKASQGGVTISGGEPFDQYPALLAFCKRLKAANYHVAIETCGNFSDAQREAIDPYVDLYLLDIKHSNPNMIRDVCGGDGLRPLHHAKMLQPDKVIYRVPVIPGFNDDEATLLDILKLASVQHVKEVNFLAYHTLGIAKYEKMQRPYTLSRKAMDPKVLDKYIEKAQNLNVKLKIGG
ncbi:hypothetical protein A4S06_07460 [Erysipelotrichaceae bacterium MTC7]|nr:hypothetical protein A4S06_07460 [Erysipelotrichaceae bacterium MTC7]